MIIRRFTACLSVVAMCLLLFACTPTATVEITTTVSPTTSTTIATTTTTVATTTTTTVAPTTTKKTTTKKNVTTTPTLSDPIVLDPTYERLLLVNTKHTISSDFKPTLATIEKKYLNGSLSQVDVGIYPYVMAMLRAAWADGIKLYVRSPYRSYNTQKTLFKNKVNKVINAGTAADKAEAVAARSVARPGTSEHQTGLAIDFNVASSTFEKSDAFYWMKEHAEDYGFILRYPKGKTNITGIIYEAWHWRFVGINTAKEINQLGLTLEEYVERRTTTDTTE